jgi:ABC-type transport system involved in multi-copper enzyme maturation permease subunit
VAAHDRAVYRARVIIAAIALVSTVWILYGLFEFAGRTSSAIGQQLFAMQAWAAFILAAGAFTATYDSISHEKRDGTLGLLFLTHLKGRDVVLGKLISGLSLFVAGILATLPIITLSLLLGGVYLSQCFSLILSVLNTMFFAAAAGLFASSISVARHRASGVAIIILLLFCVAIPLLVFTLNKFFFGFYAITHVLQYFTPVYAHQLATGSLGGLQFGYFWATLAVNAGISLALLAAASWITPRTWQQGAKEPLLKRLTERHAAWTLRTIRSRSILGRRMLDGNPYEWLAARKLSAAKSAWSFIVMIVLLATALILNFIRHNETYAVFITVCVPAAYLLQMSMKVRVGGHAADRLTQDRDSNAIELILTTPMTLSQMIQGEFSALRRHFIFPIITVCGLLLVALFLSVSGIGHISTLFSTGPENAFEGRALIFMVCCCFILGLDCVTLAWAGIWCGIASRKTQKARGNATAFVLAGPIILFCAAMPVLEHFSLVRTMLHDGTFTTPMVVGVCYLVLCDATIIYYARKWLRDSARTRLTDPVAFTRDYNPFTWIPKLIAAYNGRMRMKRAVPPAAAGSL